MTINVQGEKQGGQPLVNSTAPAAPSLMSSPPPCFIHPMPFWRAQVFSGYGPGATSLAEAEADLPGSPFFSSAGLRLLRALPSYKPAPLIFSLASLLPSRAGDTGLFALSSLCSSLT